MTGSTPPDRCGRFETEGLFQLERGEPLDEHFATCPDCKKERAVYDRLRGDLAALGADEQPSPDWQARVRQRLEQRRRRRLSWRWVLAPLGATALAATLFFALPRTPSSPALMQEVIESGSVRRATGARPGDRLALRAETAGSPHAELRVYRNGSELILRCPGNPSCHRDGGELSATLTFPSVGDFQAVLVLGPEPLPPPGKGLDPDAGAAFTRGAQVLLGDAISVR